MSTLVFADNFNRANGGLGANWTVNQGNPLISSNVVYSNGAVIATANTQASTQNQQASFVITGLSAGGRPGLCLRLGSSQGFYGASVANTSGSTKTVYLEYGDGGGWHTIVTLVLAGSMSLPVTFSFAAIGTRLYVYLDGILVLSAIDTHIGGGANGGIVNRTNESTIDDFSFNQLGSQAFVLTPDEIADPGDPQDIELSSGFGNWTPGTPGSPTFVSLFGAITAQTVNDANSATITYEPPLLHWADTITDPLNSDAARLDLSTEGQFAGGGGGSGGDSFALYDLALTNAGVTPASFAQAMVDTTLMAASSQAPILNSDPSLGLFDFLVDWFALWAPQQAPDGTSFLALINEIWARVHGDLPEQYTLYDQAQLARVNAAAAQTAAENAQASAENAYTAADAANTAAGNAYIAAQNAETAALAVGADVDAIRTGSNYTLGSPMAELAAIRGLAGWTFQDVIEYILAVRGAGAPTIADVLTAIANLPSPEVDLQPVLDAVAGVASQVSTVQSTVNTINGKADDIHGHVDTLENSAASIYSFLGDIHTDLGNQGTSILSSISALSELMLDKFALVLAAIVAVADLIKALVAPPPAHPVWPGQDNVDLGAEISVTGSTFIAQPMHGLLITRLTKQQYDGTWGGGGRHYARHWSKAAFETTEGQTEPFQYLGWESSILVPLQMQVAAGVTLYLEAGCTATVRPWTYKA